ncbi:MAG: hypothetical protein HN745_18130 [Deltaproteobacteria bacterium]|jgi:hypothetical protein|nr:hypothetical protein [Deltaproteobacteria bacterium]
MTPEIKSFQKQMNSSRMAAFYVNQFVNGLNADLAQAFGSILQSHLVRYVELPEIKKRIDSSVDFNIQLRAVLDVFPSFIFVITNELSSLPGGGYQLARGLLITGIFFIVERTHTSRSEIQLFIESLRQNENLQLTNGGQTDGESKPQTLPEVVYQDFLSIASSQMKFRTTKSSPELIENLFCFSGISQIFLKYYFDLFAEAKNDRISQQVNLIFSKLFVSLRLEEIRYWKGYNNSEVVVNRLQAMISANLPKKRHPKLHLDAFSALANYNPIIHNGSSRGMTVTTQSVLKGQLIFFHSFSITQITLLMNIVHRVKGENFSVYLLSQIIKTNKNRLLELHNYLAKQSQKSLQALVTIVGSFGKRFFPNEIGAVSRQMEKKTPAPVLDITPSARMAAAKKNIESLKDRKGMMTHDKVTKYLEERLKKLYEKVKKTGAMTQDMIPEYLAKFAKVAETFLAEANPARKQEMITAFEESTDEILDEITRFSTMKSEEVQEIRLDLHQKIAELNTGDMEQQTETVEQIGLTLSDVSDKVASEPDKGIDVTAMLQNEQISIGFDEKAPLVPLQDFFTLPFGERSGPAEEDWFEHHRRYMELAVEKNRLASSILEALPVMLPFLPKLKYRKYFNIFPKGEYEDPTCSAVYDIWKSSALERLRVD